MPWDGLLEPGRSIRQLPPGPLELDRTHPLAAGLVGLWALNGDARDYSQESNNGTLNSTTAIIAPAGPALKFNGSSAYVDLGLPASLELYSNFTVAAWIQSTTSITTTEMIIAKDYSTGARGWNLGVNSNRLYVESAGSARISGDGPTMVVGGYYHFAATLTGTTAWTAYVNGIQVGTGTTTALTANAAAHTNIGRRAYVGSNNYITGVLWLVTEHSRVLSAAEIARLYAEPCAMLRPVGRRFYLSQILSPSYGAAFGGAFSFGATGTPMQIVSASFAAAGTLQASAETSEIAAATLTGAATLASAPSSVDEAAATLTGIGTLTAASVVTDYPTALLAGIGTLTGFAEPTLAVAATLPGIGTLTGSVESIITAAATLAVVSTLGASPFPLDHVAATLAGTGTLSAQIGTLPANATATLGAVFGFSAAALSTEEAAATLGGVLAFTATGTTRGTAAAMLAGYGSISAAGLPILDVAATLSGAGALGASIPVEVGAIFVGSGALQTATAPPPAPTVTFDGFGILTAQWSIPVPPPLPPLIASPQRISVAAFVNRGSAASFISRNASADGVSRSSQSRGP